MREACETAGHLWRTKIALNGADDSIRRSAGDTTDSQSLILWNAAESPLPSMRRLFIPLGAGERGPQAVAIFQRKVATGSGCYVSRDAL